MMFENLDRVMAPYDTLRAECSTCGRSKEWTQREAFKIFGAGAAPFHIRRRLVCTNCGERELIRVWI